MLWDLNKIRCIAAVADLQKQDIEAQAFEVDISSEDSVVYAFKQVLSQVPQIHVVINAAGIVGPTGIKTEEVSLNEFSRTCQINLIGSFIITKYSIRAMLPNDYGRILLISSIAGKEGNAGMCAYSASKSGVIGLVKAAGKEYADSGITINALAPATVMTPMVEAMDPIQVKYMTDKIPMKRCGTLEEVANISAWVVSSEASFNTGFVFDLTGGRAVY